MYFLGEGLKRFKKKGELGVNLRGGGCFGEVNILKKKIKVSSPNGFGGMKF